MTWHRPQSPPQCDKTPKSITKYEKKKQLGNEEFLIITGVKGGLETKVAEYLESNDKIHRTHLTWYSEDIHSLHT